MFDMEQGQNPNITTLNTYAFQCGGGDCGGNCGGGGKECDGDCNG